MYDLNEFICSYVINGMIIIIDDIYEYERNGAADVLLRFYESYHRLLIIIYTKTLTTHFVSLLRNLKKRF
jgi:hypothetical protein